MTLGAQGVLAAGRDGAFRLRVPPVARVIYATGSGDMLLAGFVLGCARGEDLKSAVRFGASLSVANVGTLEPVLDQEIDLAALADAMEVERLDLGVARQVAG